MPTTINEIDETRALITLEEARLFVYRDANDRSRDELLIDAVNDVSDAIWEHCEREFLPSAANVTRTFQLKRRNIDGKRVGWIDLAPYDLQSTDQVRLYTDTTSPKTLTVDEYRLRPLPIALGGTYLEILTLEPVGAEEQPGFGWEATVRGQWGMASVPSAVKLACKQWVDNIVKNPGAYASTEMGGLVVTPEVDFAPARAGMPAAVRHRLQRFRRSV